VTPPPSQPTDNRIVVPRQVPSAGPLKTAMVSAYSDSQERDLRQRLRAFGVNIARRGDTMVLNINNAVLFDGGALSLEGSNLLATLSIILRRYDHSAVAVSGYTDTAGTPEENMALSLKRARQVADALAKNGVARPRLSTQAFGETNLKVRTGDSVKEPRNRRVEVRITPTPAG
jgi:outer membrane protein OmpA-like peptidoglycan-associated protein